MARPGTSAIASEISNDPATMGYLGKTAAQITALMNDTSLRSRQRQSITGAELFNAVDDAEFDALTTAEKEAVDRITCLSGDIDVRQGMRARVVTLRVFGAGTTTRSSFQAVAQETISRAQEMGWPKVKEGWVERALA